MSLPTRLDAYHDCIDIFDAAVANTKGRRVAFATREKANIFQLRMCNARRLHREESTRLYERDDPQWGRSPYDRLVVRKPVEDEAGEWWVYIEPHGSDILAVEDVA
jgi:hypothetical protein